MSDDVSPPADPSDAQLAAVFGTAGLGIPPDRQAEVFALARWMKQQARLVAGPHPVGLEPAVTFNRVGRK